ncbi:MAG: hypothetical protein IT364_07230 [Candidatus Hydrogenedentes bacterium]|nr:hypothetical protein [Candidatus Hydrogenedentota bacterium]
MTVHGSYFWDRTQRRCTKVTCICLLAAGLGCGWQPAAPRTSDVPPPGTMMTVSVTPIELAPAPNLIQNGDFSAWQADASAPDYFGAPDAARGVSVIEPERGEDGAVWAVRQTWSASDAIDAYPKLFHVWVTNLKPDTRYRFSLRVRNESPNLMLVRAFRYAVRTPAEALVSNDPPQVLGNISFGQTQGFEEHAFDFQTGGAGDFCVLIGAKNNAVEGTFPAVCVWDEWAVRPVATPQAPPQ